MELKKILGFLVGLYEGLGDGGDSGEREEWRGEIDLIWGVLHSMRRMSKWRESFIHSWKYTVSTAKRGLN